MGDQWDGGPMSRGDQWDGGPMEWVVHGCHLGDQWDGRPMIWGTNEMGDQWDGGPMRWGTNDVHPKQTPTAAQDDVIKWKHFPRYWPFVWGIHRSVVNSPHKGQWRGALIMFSLIYACSNGWVNNWDASDLTRHRAHYNVTVIDCMFAGISCTPFT